MAINSLSAFTPNTAATVTVAVTSSSGSTAVALVGGGQSINLTNAGPAIAFVELGPSTQTAAVATGFPLLPGEVFTVTRTRNATHVVAITSASTATVYATTGDGD
jgi:hypothetical protein